MKTPLPPTEPEGLEPVEAMTEFEYLSIASLVLYASTCCRPDIQHGVSVVAQSCKQRHQIHCLKLERVLKYLLQTKDTHLCYGSNGSDMILRAYCDASFGSISKSDTNQRSSGCPISWCAKRFNSTSLRVCEAEMMAIKETTTQAIHLQALLKDFEEAQDARTTVHTDSKAARDNLLCENFSMRLKHVTIARLWIREHLESGIIEVKHERTHHQLADFYTKPLPAAPFKHCCNLLGLKTPKDQAQDQDQE